MYNKSNQWSWSQREFVVTSQTVGGRLTGVLKHVSHRHERDRVAKGPVTLDACRRPGRFDADKAVFTLEKESRTVGQRQSKTLTLSHRTLVHRRLQPSYENHPSFSFSSFSDQSVLKNLFSYSF